MKLEPAKNEKILAIIKKLSELGAPLRREDERDWAADTIKTLQAGRLEDFDLSEFAVAEYESRCAGREDKRHVWEFSRALLELLDEMAARKIGSERSKRARQSLQAWTNEAL